MKYHLKRRNTEGFLKELFFQFEVPAYFQTDQGGFPKGAVFVNGKSQEIGRNWLSSFRCLRVLDEEPIQVRSSPRCRKCETDGAYTHTDKVIENVTVEGFQGDCEEGFFPQDDYSSSYFITEKLAGRLRASGLKGIEFGKVRVLYGDRDEVQESEDVEVLNLTGKTCAASDIALATDVADACPHCRNTPLFCPKCRFYRNPCPKCKKHTGIMAGHEDGPEDRRLRIEPSPGALWIVDGHKWDGSDFMTGGLITKRALDFLLSIHAAPFWYRPALVDVTGVSDEKLKQIRAAADPVIPKRS